jgi:GDP-L-fucose synthase
MVGSAIDRALARAGFTNVVGPLPGQLDLQDQAAVNAFFDREKPEYVFLAAAKVGGIHANSTYPADFIYNNMQIQNNVIHASWRTGVRKLLFLGSSCIYPKFAPQPMKEECLLTGPLEPTNEPYAIAKIAGIRTCQAFNKQYGTNFISVMPTNLYGPNDNYDPMNSHVLPALLRRFHEAKERGDAEVVVWGTGTPKREFLFVDDLADACLHLMQTYDGDEIVNIGSGEEVTIAELAAHVMRGVGYEGRLVFDPTKPDGTPRKLLDLTRLHGLGWRAKTMLDEGIKLAYTDFLDHLAGRRGGLRER